MSVDLICCSFELFCSVYWSKLSGCVIFQADMLISELLGSFGCNELSPECLDGAQKYLKPDGLSIPCSYTNYVQPIMAVNLYEDLLSYAPVSRKVIDEMVLVDLRAFAQIDSYQEAFTFRHPNFGILFSCSSIRSFVPSIDWLGIFFSQMFILMHVMQCWLSTQTTTTNWRDLPAIFISNSTTTSPWTSCRISTLSAWPVGFPRFLDSLGRWTWSGATKLSSILAGGSARRIGVSGIRGDFSNRMSCRCRTPRPPTGSQCDAIPFFGIHRKVFSIHWQFH